MSKVLRLISVPAAITCLLLTGLGEANADSGLHPSGSSGEVGVHSGIDGQPKLAAYQTVEGQISGRVLEASTGRPLANVRVSVLGTQTGAISDQSGGFRLTEIAAGPVTLRAEMIGYIPAELAVEVVDGAITSVEIRLAHAAIALDEVVVTGTAGRTERRAQGAVIATVDADVIVEAAPVTGVADVLQGRIPGVSLTQASGVAGAGQQIRIRGASSISISNEPLIYIDGVRADSRLGDGDVSRLGDIDPTQIESIEVVKGPAAATLYGADASAGVIQIITKKGAVGGGFQHTVETQFHSVEPGVTSWTNYGRCGPAQISNPDLVLCNGATVGTLVTDDPLARSGVMRDGAVRSFSWSMNGGGEAYRVFTSISSHEEEGTLPNNEFNRLSGRVNYSFFPRENLEIGTSLGLMRVRTDLPTTGGSGFGYTIAMFAGSPLTVGGPQNGLRHPYLDFDAIAAIETAQTVTRAVPDLRVVYSPASWFTNRLVLGTDVSTTQGSQLYPRNDVGYYQRGRDAGQISEWRSSFARYTLNYLGTLTRQHSDNWTSSLSLGTEVLAETDDYTFAEGLGLTTNAARSVNSAAEVTGGQEYREDRRVGIFGQWEPSYADRLFFQFGLRADKFAAFGSDVDWFMSPSARVSYVASEEPRIRDALPPFISSFRIRGAVGTTGRAPGTGAALATYSPTAFLRENGSLGSGIIPLNPGNPLLRAEKGQEYEAGFDASLSERISAEYTYFHKVTTDLLLQVPQPPSLGYADFAFRNLGEVRNSGHELALAADLIRRPSLAWDVRIAGNTLDNKVISLGGVEPFSSIRFDGTNRVAEGYPVGAFFTHRIREIDVASNRVLVSDTLEYVGNLLPGFEGNFTSNLRIAGNLRLYAHVDWKRDLMLYNTTAAYRDHSYGNSQYAARVEGITDAEILSRFGPFYDSNGNQVNRALVNESYIEPGDFVRLNELSLTYDLPGGWVAGTGADRASLQLGGRNLRVWTDYTGLDPDVQNEFDAVAGRADFGSFPSGPRYTLRVTVNF